MHSHGSFAALPLIWYWEYTRNATFLTDGTLATVDRAATPYALVTGLADWWVCHLTKEESPPSTASAAAAAVAGASQGGAAATYVYVDLDDCACASLCQVTAISLLYHAHH